MIFPSPAVEQARRELAEKLASAAIEPAQSFEQLLAVDPNDRVALLELSRMKLAAGDRGSAETLARRVVVAHPCDFSPYLLLSGIVAESQPQLADGLLELGLRKLLSDPESLAEAQRLGRLGKVPVIGLDDHGVALALADDLLQRRDTEPASVTMELRPFRLLHELQEALGNELDRALVDAILAEGPACQPLLAGALRDLADGILPEGGELIGEAALALLGEIGDPSILPELVPFGVIDDKELTDVATWALLRIADRQPAASVAALATFDRTAGGAERACIAETIAIMPEAPGKTAALLALLDNFAAVPESERTEVFVVIGAALLGVAGKEAPPIIRQALTDHRTILPQETRPQIDDMLRAYAKDPSLFAIAGEDRVPTVHDICCADRIAAYEEGEEEEDEDHVHGPGCNHHHEEHAPQLPGRNEPCWCGSGKKYKKCHLAEDEATHLQRKVETE